MTWTVVAALLGLACFALMRGGKYGRLFSAIHLTELARTLVDLRREAATQTDESEAPAHRVTSAGLVIAYSVTDMAGRSHDHVSLSHMSGVLARIAAERVAALLARILSVEPRKVTVWQGDRAHHIEFDVEEPARGARAIEPPTREAVAAIWRDLGDALATIHRSGGGGPPR